MYICIYIYIYTTNLVDDKKNNSRWNMDLSKQFYFVGYMQPKK